MPEPISFTIGLLIGGATKAAAGKAVVAGGTKLAASGAMKSAAIASSHAAVSSTTVAASALSVVEGVALGALGVAVLERLLKGRHVGPTGEKIAHNLAHCVEKNIMSETEAQSQMDSVETMSEAKKQKVNAEVKDVFRRYGM